MIEPTRWENCALDESKVSADVTGEVRTGENFGMTHGEDSVLADVRIETADIIVPDLLTVTTLIEQTRGVRPTT